MLVGSNLLLAAFISWAPASVLLALLAGAVLGRVRDDEMPAPAVLAGGEARLMPESLELAEIRAV